MKLMQFIIFRQIIIIYQHCNCNYSMKPQLIDDEEEGFADESATELIEYNYQPCFSQWRTFKSRSQMQPKIPRIKLLNSQNLINQGIKNQWLRNLYAEISDKKENNIVFNNESSTQVTFREQNLQFESDFQSGNLAIITKINQNQYDMYMKPDTNTKSHFQWFYFKVFIKKGSRTIKFRIRNFIKSTMLYSKGLKPYCRSLKNPQYHQFKQIEAQIIKFYEDKTEDYYNLEFTFNFEFDKDQIEFCSQPPYTFAHLNTLLPTLKRCKRLTLGKTIMDHKIPYLIYEAKKQAKIISVVVARQHPGEAVGSWMMEGFLNQIEQKYAIDLKKEHNNLAGLATQYISWIIVPMINIDGVVLGNNRTGVLGHDFNRNWYPDEFLSKKNCKLFPQTQSIISLIKSLRKKYPRKVRMFLDLHGHSSQPNVFTYGPPHQPKSQYFYQSRLFPEILSSKNQNFNLSQCSYQIHAQKKQTARSVIFHNLAVPFTYTIQSTFGVMNGKCVTTDDFLKIGNDIYESAAEFLMTTASLPIDSELKQKYDNIIQNVKLKYADDQNQRQQYQSASEASDEDPNRIKIEELLINDRLPLQKQNNKLQKNGRYTNQRIRHTQTSSQERKIQLRNSAYIPIKYSDHKSLQNRNLKKKRASTEADFLMNRHQGMFPKITTKNTNLGFDSYDDKEKAEERKKNFKIEDVQKRLYRLRNSKIGKKILVINAYYS